MSSDQVAGTDRRRLTMLSLVLTFGFSVLLAQLFRWQVLSHSELQEWAERQRRWETEVPSTRGYISDANGHIIAMDVVSWDISVSPPLVMDADSLADNLAPLLPIPREELHAKVSQDVAWVPLARRVPQELGEEIAQLRDSSLTCEPHAARVYPAGELASHAIGIVTDTGDGFYGVEGFHDQQLRPVPGKRQTEHGPGGVELPIAPLAQDPPREGTSLVLTLDLNIQYIVEQELHSALERYGAKSGTIIVMKPTTGEILAIASYPAYDPNTFASTDPKHFADPAISSMWEPGSAFKVVTWAAGLDAGVIKPNTKFRDEGKMEVGGRVIRNADRQAYGLVTMEDGIVHSLNTVAAYISTSLGKDLFYTYVRRFGFGDLTGVDLSSEGPGMVKYPGDSNWFPSDLGTNAFGQGIAVTPIQLITAVSAVANQGLLMQPHIVRQYVTTNELGKIERVTEVQPTVVRRAIAQKAADSVTQMMAQSIEKKIEEARIPGYRVAGKTGTAQVPTPYGYHPKQTITSFVGFAPADDPQFTILVKLDQPKSSPWGSHTAAPTFRAIAERLFVYLKIPPDRVRLAQR
ncbi:peptidoglycan D,D-transpeptidase FtsI family protein [Chloroflexota bacterium]